MNKKEWKYLVLLGAALLFMVLMELFGPKPLDFTPNFSIKKDIPYGCSALGKVLPGFTNKGYTINQAPLYNLNKSTTDTNRIYFVVTSKFSPDALDFQQIMNLSAEGNHFIIAAFEYGEVFQDSLKISVESYFQTSNNLLKLKDTSSIFIQHPQKEQLQQFVLKRYGNYSYFKMEPENYMVLGSLRNGKPNFIQIPNGKGSINLICEPLLFTNYYFAYHQLYNYTELLLNHFPDYPVVWDEYYKPNKMVTDASPVRFILKTKPLRIAWYLLLISLFVYLLFGSRRQQRKIPIVSPPRNQSLEFTRTLGQLYFNKGSHIDLVKKKMQHLQSFLGQKYFINSQMEDEALYAKIAAKSGVPQKDIAYIFNTYYWIIKQNNISDTELNRFTTLANNFYKKCT